MSKQTVALIILDGWGVGKNDQSNPLFAANLQNINYIKANFPLACLQSVRNRFWESHGEKKETVKSDTSPLAPEK